MPISHSTQSTTKPHQTNSNTNMDPTASTTLAASSQLPRRTPAKSIDSMVPISAGTRAILKRKTRRDYLTSADLPAELDLSNCQDLVDVGALGQVHTLYLNGYTGVVDVSTLGTVHTLDLRGCTGIVDVSALGTVHTLDLSRCTGIVDVSALGTVHTLDLSGCTGVIDFSAVRQATLTHLI
mmetsp:Transcript_6913/g.21066  ORF Transcript_6913/g.21066 Transcript_6913/m.21066 type:complete len:181 (-) Transcript_6913:38-580(-)